MDQNDRDEFLKAKGAADHVIKAGLAGLLDNWERVVASVQKGYALGLDDYLNDMDVRQLLEETLAAVSEKERLKYQGRLRQSDALMRTLVKTTDKCLWGDPSARSEGWTREKNWWYFSRPLQGDAEFLSELEDI
jgi:hypothetical protein